MQYVALRIELLNSLYALLTALLLYDLTFVLHFPFWFIVHYFYVFEFTELMINILVDQASSTFYQKRFFTSCDFQVERRIIIFFIVLNVFVIGPPKLCLSTPLGTSTD